MRLHDEDPHYGDGEYEWSDWEFWSVFVLLGLIMIFLAIVGASAGP